jgi:hypothetical protein
VTTQPIADDASGTQPAAVAAPPASLLLPDLPLRPALLSPLGVSLLSSPLYYLSPSLTSPQLLCLAISPVPYQYNIWIGQSASGTSSGLHHDFHDNLYVLLRGRKRFVLFSPADAQSLYPHGEISLIHSNGLINYNGLLTRADGSDERAFAETMQQEAEEALAVAERNLATLMQQRNKKAGGKAPSSSSDEALIAAQERVAEAEEALEAAMDAVLLSRDVGSDDDFDFDGIDDQDSDGGGSDDDSDAEVRQRSKAKQGRTKPCDKQQQQVQDDADEQARAWKERHAHFSQIDADLLHPQQQQQQQQVVEQKRARFPLFNRAQRVTCEIRAGQMLYLPAGWFHEVTSFSNVPVTDSADGAAEQAAEHDDSSQIGTHMAFNYWFYPPDGQDFEQPYTSSFWPRRWQAKQHELLQARTQDESSSQATQDAPATSAATTAADSDTKSSPISSGSAGDKAHQMPHAGKSDRKPKSTGGTKRKHSAAASGTTKRSKHV